MTGFSIYQGSLRHRRFFPKAHAFTYQVTYWLIDLDHTDALQSAIKPSPFSFRQLDYLDGKSYDLKTKTVDEIQAKYPECSIDQVKLLTQIRCFGYIINPISVFYAFNQGKLQALILEVTNTPWGERIRYVLKTNPNEPHQRISFNKAMHVSPFNPMNFTYVWQSTEPLNKLAIHLSCLQEDNKQLDATLKLAKSRNKGGLLMTWKIACLIYIEALKLLVVKRIPFYSHP